MQLMILLWHRALLVCFSRGATRISGNATKGNYHLP